METDIGVVGNAKKWISSFLSCHSQRVLINQNSSKSFDIDCGVPQGSCLGPILFNMYVSRIFNVVENHPSSIYAYAACMWMYLSFKPLSTSSQHDALRASQACIAEFRAFGNMIGCRGFLTQPRATSALYTRSVTTHQSFIIYIGYQWPTGFNLKYCYLSTELSSMLPLST